MPGVVARSDLLGRRSRIGTVRDECKSTFETILAAIDHKAVADALELTQFCLESECKSVYDIMREWQSALVGLLSARGVSDETIGALEENFASLLSVPDGTDYDHEGGWTYLSESFSTLSQHVLAEDWHEARSAVLKAREDWRIVHDREIDWTFGLMSEFAARFGEPAIPTMFDAIGRHHFDEFFALGDPIKRSWSSQGCEAIVRDALEAMRIHLSTLHRDGDTLELREYEDRWVMEFDPCGSGGRAVRGDWIEGTPSRLGPPYNFGVIEEAYTWTDGKRGVCIYCNHCQQIYEQWSLEKAGFPFYVVEPPLYPMGAPVETDRQRCQYTIYKDPLSVPDEIYERCGKAPPDRTRVDAPPPAV